MYLTHNEDVLYPRTVNSMSPHELMLCSNHGNVIRITLTNTPYHEVRELRLRNIYDELNSYVLGYEWHLYYENMQGIFYDDSIPYDVIGDFLYTYLMNDCIIEFIHEFNDTRRALDCIMHE